MRPGAAEGRKANMKTIQLIAIAASLGLVATAAQAHDEALSPKAREQRAEPLRGGTEVTQSFEFTRGNKIASTRATGMASKGDRDLVREQRNIVYTGKNPLRDSQPQFEVAPVK
jgi:hypothetical protein